MFTTLTTLIARLDSSAVSRTSIIRWGSPVPSFGDLSNSLVATLGLNPSNREFMDESGNELQGNSRRFHTLNSLGLSSWSDVDSRHLRLILDSCRSYFNVNPYNTWFNRLERVISAADVSYYYGSRRACHLDLIPYATNRKWTELTAHERALLLRVSGDTLALLLRDSPVRILILDGASVVKQFEELAGVSLDKQDMRKWSLPRQSKPDVAGVAYRGVVDNLAGIGLGRELQVLGFNHNLQGSFGVTAEVVMSIRSWIARAVSESRQ